MELYGILQVPPDSSQEVIKQAYKKRAQELHPDRNTAEDAEEKFKELQHAYAILSDPEKRKRYDDTGSTEQTKKPDKKTEAVKYLTFLFEKFLNDNQNELIDYVEAAREHTNVQMQRVKKANLDFDAQIPKIRRLIDRAKGDILAGILKKKLETCYSSIEQNEFGYEMMEEALDILDQHELKPDPALNTDRVSAWARNDGNPFQNYIDFQGGKFTRG